MNKSRLLLGFIGSILILLNILIAGPATSAVLTIEGPRLASNVTGWSESGLKLSVFTNVTLESFIFQNSENPDTIWLKDESLNILETYNYAGGDASHFIDVSWQLEAGKSYFLLTDHPNNGEWAYYNYLSNPPINSHIEIEGTWNGDSGSLNNQYWFYFNDITTANVPIAPALWLFGSGLLSLVGMARRKKAA